MIYTIEQVLLIEEKACDLLEYVCQTDKGELPGCFDFLRTIIRNIRVDKKDNFEDIQLLSSYITEDFNSMFPAHGGLPDYYIELHDKEQMAECNRVLSEKIAALYDAIEVAKKA